MVGGIEAFSPCVKRTSVDMFLDLPTTSAQSGEDHMLEEAAQIERAALWLCRSTCAQPGVWCAHS